MSFFLLSLFFFYFISVLFCVEMILRCDIILKMVNRLWICAKFECRVLKDKNKNTIVIVF